VNLVAIQPLKDTLKSKLQEFAHSKAGFRTLARESLRQVAGLLQVLQGSLGFEHRDLHTNNVMYNIEQNTFQFYIIDFGFTRTKQLETGTLDRRWPSHFIAGGDLAMLVMDIYGLGCPGTMSSFCPRVCVHRRSRWPRRCRGWWGAGKTCGRACTVGEISSTALNRWSNRSRPPTCCA